MATRKKAGADLAALEEIGHQTDALQERLKGARSLAIARLQPNPDQPRKRYDPKAFAELKDSIQEVGILQPLVVRPHDDGKFQIVCGERRYRAACELGLQHVPTIVKEVDDLTALRMAYEENIQREDLSLIDEASFLHGLLDKGLVKNQRELAKAMGVSEGRVSQKLQVLKFPEPVIKGFKENAFLTEFHARALARIEDEKVQHRVFNAILRDESSARRTEALVGRILEAVGSKHPKQSRRRSKTATFKDATIVEDRKHYILRVPFEAAASLEDLAELLTGLARALKAKEVHF